jgi:hypothetical protein
MWSRNDSPFWCTWFHPDFCGVRVAVMFCRSLFVLLPFCPLYCLSSSIYGFWLLIWYLQIVLIIHFITFFLVSHVIVIGGYSFLILIMYVFINTCTTVYIHNDSFPIKLAFLPPFRIRKLFHSDFWFIFTTDGEYVLSIYLLIAIFSDLKHRWRNTIYIQEIEIRSYVISLGDNDFIFSAQKIFVTHLRNIKKENFKSVMFLE